MRRSLLGCVCVAMTIDAAHAQSDAGLIAMPAESQVACLNRADGSRLPEYPQREFALKEGGVVRLRLTFVNPDAAPQVAVTFDSGGAAFVDAASTFAKTYRLPCLGLGAAPVVAMQEFQFVPDDGRKVISGVLRDIPEAASAIRCVTGNGRKPAYPSSGFLPPPEGTVVVQMRFTDGISPPQLKVLYDGGSSRLEAAVLAVVEQYRAPCLTTGGAPFTAMQSFKFVMSDSTQYALRDLPLDRFVASLDGLDKHPVRFDFHTMGCPFDVRLRLFQPHAPNQVGELERADPNRLEFLAWLKGVSMKLPAAAARQVIGQTMTIFVPCVVLDLT